MPRAIRRVAAPTKRSRSPSRRIGIGPPVRQPLPGAPLLAAGAPGRPLLIGPAGPGCRRERGAGGADRARWPRAGSARARAGGLARRSGGEARRCRPRPDRRTARARGRARLVPGPAGASPVRACAGNRRSRASCTAAPGYAGAPREGPRGRSAGRRRALRRSCEVGCSVTRVESIRPGLRAVRAVRPAAPIPGMCAPGTESARRQDRARSVTGRSAVAAAPVAAAAPVRPARPSARRTAVALVPLAHVLPPLGDVWSSPAPCCGSCPAVRPCGGRSYGCTTGAHQGSHEDTVRGRTVPVLGQGGNRPGRIRAASAASRRGTAHPRRGSPPPPPAPPPVPCAASSASIRPARCACANSSSSSQRQLAVRVHGDVQEVILGVDPARPTGQRLLQVHVPVLEPPARLPEQPHRPGLAGPRQLQHARAEPAVAPHRCAAWCSGSRAAPRAPVCRRRAPASRTRVPGAIHTASSSVVVLYDGHGAADVDARRRRSPGTATGSGSRAPSAPSTARFHCSHRSTVCHDQILGATGIRRCGARHGSRHGDVRRCHQASGGDAVTDASSAGRRAPRRAAPR